MRMQRMWAMPSSDTFDCPPISDFVQRYISQSHVSIDPFARNKRLATYTNDLNPNTVAEYHMKAVDFLRMLRDQGVQADLIIFDPPYSPRQIKECYNGIGLEMRTEDAWLTNGWPDERKLSYDLLIPNGTFLYFGWNSNGLGKMYHAVIIEILLIAHGPGHNDTICMAERKIAHQGVLPIGGRDEDM